ncbi:MAG: VanZ family protein [Planctomycetota bacterium]
MARSAGWWAARPRPVRWAALLGEMGLLWWSSSRQLTGAGAGWPRALLHNAAHVVAYGGMALLALLALRGGAAARRRDLWFAWGVAVAYGGVDEIHQRFVPGRTSSVADLLADAAGAALALSILLAARTGAVRWRRCGWAAGFVAAAAVLLATFSDF